MSTTELFKKHFGDVCAVDLKHKNIEAFFNDLNKECQEENEKRNEENQLKNGKNHDSIN